MNPIQRAAQDLLGSRCAVALTGAGISVESGIPPFRGRGGVWEKIDPMEYAHIDAFMRNPAKVWDVLIREMKSVIDSAAPNAAHTGLARLEELGILKGIITQNVDGLHQKAGSLEVIEFHGNFAWHSCLICKKRCETAAIDMTEIPPRCACGGIWRPECVFFGESIPHEAMFRSHRLAEECDLMLVIGTSAVVHPVAGMPVIAKDKGAKVIEINPEPTPLTREISDYMVRGKAGEVVREIVAIIESKNPS